MESKPKVWHYEFEGFRVICVATGHFRENAYIVHPTASDRAVLIDPGDDPDLITAELEKLRVRVGGILLTHGHFDHVGAITDLSSAEIPIYLHKKDQRLYRRADLYSRSFIQKKLTVPKKTVPYAIPEVGLPFCPPVRVLETPGHTGGGVTLFFEPAFAFTGDTFLFEKIGGSDYPESNHEDLLQSVEGILQAVPPGTVLFPGHGKPWTAEEAGQWWQANKAHPKQLKLFSPPQPPAGRVQR